MRPSHPVPHVVQERLNLQRLALGLNSSSKPGTPALRRRSHLEARFAEHTVTTAYYLTRSCAYGPTCANKHLTRLAFGAT